MFLGLCQLSIMELFAKEVFLQKCSSKIFEKVLNTSLVIGVPLNICSGKFRKISVNELMVGSIFSKFTDFRSVNLQKKTSS